MKLTIKEAALHDVENIRRYICGTLKNPAAAENTVRRIRTDIARLKDSPFIGTSLNTKTEIPNPYRFLVSGSYIVIYKIHDDCVKVLRVYNSRQDYIEDIFTGFSDKEE